MLKNPAIYPDTSILKNVLGDSYNTYTNLLELFKKHGLEYEWRYYKDGKAWLCKVTKQKKTIVWMSAWKGYVKATVYVPEKHIEGIYATELEPETKEFIRATQNVGKSKPCMFDIKTPQEIGEIEKVMLYRMAIK